MLLQTCCTSIASNQTSSEGSFRSAGEHVSRQLGLITEALAATLGNALM